MTSTSAKSPLTTLSGLLCFFLAWASSASSPPDGYETYSYVVMIAFGCAIGATQDAATRKGRS